MPNQYRIEILPTAWEDLKKIEDYYLINYDENIALKLVNEILNFVERLEQFPDSGTLVSSRWLENSDYRMIVYKKYVIIYRKIEEIIYVYHIADTKTEYNKLFKWVGL